MLTKFTKFEGTAEVLGKAREVAYDGVALTIRGLSSDEATGLLDQLRASVVSPDALKTAPVAQAKKPGPAPKAAAKKEDKAPDKKPDSNGAAARADQASSPVASADPAPGGSIEEKASTAPAADDPSKEDKAPDIKPANGSGVVAIADALLKAPKLRDVLTYLLEYGNCKTVEDLLAACRGLKSQIPMLDRIPDLDDRVRRAAVAFGVA